MPGTQDTFIEAIQRRTARVAVGSSAARNQGAPGLVSAAREFFATLPLENFGVSNPAIFRQRLDRATGNLFGALPREAQSWGLARKLLNIFLRDALYTAYLRTRFGLDAAEELYELPLDSIRPGTYGGKTGLGNCHAGVVSSTLRQK